MSKLDGVDDVNMGGQWRTWPVPQASENKQRREVLLVDKTGRPLLVKEPRKVGFRKP